MTATRILIMISLTLRVHADGTSFSFTKENNLLRTINALDYVPLIFLFKLPP